MAISLVETGLGEDIGDALKKNYFIGEKSSDSEDLTDEEKAVKTDADKIIDKMANAIATAVVSHINNNLVVTSEGLGYSGFLVKSTSATPIPTPEEE